jgi:hypothetical protein
MTPGGNENARLPEGFSEKELRLSYWWVTRGAKVKKILVGLFIAVDAVLLGFGLWGLFDWLVLGGLDEARQIRILTSPAYGVARTGEVVRELQFGTPTVFQLRDGRHDVVFPVENVNPRHWAELTYRAVLGGEESGARTAFILPGETKFLTALGLDVKGGGAVDIKVERRDWRRVDAHAVGDYAEFAERRLDIQALNPAYEPPSGEPGGAGRTTFTLANMTAFGYRDVDVTVLLYRGDALVGVNAVRLDRLEAGARRRMELFWFQDIPQVTRTEVQAGVNILDEDAYLAPG